jgi:hypothetical protein
MAGWDAQGYPMDIGYQLVARDSAGLFQRAIMESGVFDMKLPTPSEWEAEGVTLPELRRAKRSRACGGR